MSGMKSLRKQRRMQIVGIALASVAAMLAVLWFLPDDSFQFFRSPTELSEAPPPPNEVFRIGGLVEGGSVVRGESEQISFNVTDGGAVVPVVYVGILPDLFNEGQGMVATGRYIDGTFQATEILARHDESYMPAEVIEALQEQGVYVDPDGGAATN